MKLTHLVLSNLQPYARAAKLFLWLAAGLGLSTIALPVFWPQIDTAVWLLVLSLFAFTLINFALFSLAKHYRDTHTGVFGWVRNGWQNLVFLSWLLTLLALIYLVLKVVLFVSAE